MRRVALVLTSVVLTACGPARRAWQPPPVPVDAAAPAAFAVVLLSQPLSTAPSSEAPAVWGTSPVALYGGGAPEPSFAVVRVLGTEGDWVAVETLGEPSEAHCVPGVEGLEAFRLRLFARSSALVPVTQREVVQQLDDGTRVALGRGAPLEPLPQRDFYRARLGVLRTVLRVDRASVGTRYLPSAPVTLEPTPRVLSPDVLPAALPILGRTGRVDAALPVAYPVHDEGVRGGESFVELRARCGRLVVRVPSHAVVDAPPADPPAPDASPRTGPTVRAGTIVHWRDGRAAGVTTRTVQLGAEFAPSGRRRCFAHALRPITPADPSPELELCIDRGAVDEPGIGAAHRLDPPGSYQYPRLELPPGSSAQ